MIERKQENPQVQKIIEWRETLSGMENQQFFSLIHLYLGEVKTPYNKQNLIEQLSSFLRKEENQNLIFNLLSENVNSKSAEIVRIKNDIAALQNAMNSVGDSNSIAALQNQINYLNSELNKKLEIEGVSLTMYDGRALVSRQIAEEIRKFFGKKFFLPAHQGRACENILAKTLVKPGDVVPMNYHFTTAKAHITRLGGHVEELVKDEGLVSKSDLPFKGNIDLDKVKACIEKEGADNIAYLRLEAGTNLIGGQPISYENMKRFKGHHTSVTEEMEVPLIILSK